MEKKLKSYSVWFAKDVGFLRVDAENAEDAQEKADDLFTQHGGNPPGFEVACDETEWVYPVSLIKEDNDEWDERNNKIKIDRETALRNLQELQADYLDLTDKDLIDCRKIMQERVDACLVALDEQNEDNEYD
jgi:hypothetical protein